MNNYTYTYITKTRHKNGLHFMHSFFDEQTTLKVAIGIF